MKEGSFDVGHQQTEEGPEGHNNLLVKEGSFDVGHQQTEEGGSKDLTLLLWIIVALGIVMILTLVGQSIWSPVKWVGYGLFKIAMGGIILFVFNSIGGYYDFTIPINPVTAAMSGLLGIPGLVSLVLMKAFIVV